MYYGYENCCLIPSTFSFPEFPIRYWEGSCEDGEFWVSKEMIDYMLKHAYYGVPYDDDDNIERNYLCTSFIHDEVTYRVIYAVQPEDQREIAMDNFRKAIKMCPLMTFDRDETIQDPCLTNKNLLFLNKYYTRFNDEAYPFLKIPDPSRGVRHN